MYRTIHFTRFLLISTALHVLFLMIALFLLRPALQKEPTAIPVNIVNLPAQEVQKLPPIQQPTPVPKQVVPERPLPPGQVPMPKKFGTSEEVVLPKTTPPAGIPGGAETGASTGHKAPGPTDTTLHQERKGPLPFLSQNDIDELARRGMPEKRPGDESVTLDTDEFKFISYNRWLKIKVESMLKYPELAAISGYQGTLYIKFDIMKDGSLGGVELLKSSGYKILDDEALRSIQSAAPFQPLPEEWHMDKYSIRAAVLFYLHEAYIR